MPLDGAWEVFKAHGSGSEVPRGRAARLPGCLGWVPEAGPDARSSRKDPASDADGVNVIFNHVVVADKYARHAGLRHRAADG
jgi:hypothetical protein